MAYCLCVVGDASETPEWDQLYEIAAAQEGLFTTQQAAEAGYSPQLLVHHIRGGRMVRVRRGIYRLVHFPAGEHEELVTVWLWSEQAGVLSHETALPSSPASSTVSASGWTSPSAIRSWANPRSSPPTMCWTSSASSRPRSGCIRSRHTSPRSCTPITMPRPRPNSRVKDLPDIALLASIGALEASRLAEALGQTFTFRKTHALPASLPDPNAAWETPYAVMAKADQLAWPTLADVTEAAKAFLDPILAGERDARWDPTPWRWVR